jgi:hypothetical protein
MAEVSPIESLTELPCSRIDDKFVACGICGVVIPDFSSATCRHLEHHQQMDRFIRTVTNALTVIAKRLRRG